MRKLLLLVIPAILLWNNCLNAQSALEFDGLDDYVYAGNDVALTSYTKEAWVKWDGLDAPNYSIISGEPDNRHIMWIGGSQMRGGHYPDEVAVTDPNEVVVNEWTHFSITYDGDTGLMILYKNGEFVIQRFIDPGFVLSAINIGKTDLFGIGKFNLMKGSLDDIRLWDHVRTPEEIAGNYQSCLTGAEEGLVAFYNFADGTGSDTLSDVTGNGNNGVLINFDTNNAWVEGINCNDDSEEEEEPLTTSLSPINDAYLQYGSRYNSNIVRVEKGRRTGYLMFDTSDITGTIVDAKLKFTVTSDPGYGNLNVNKGTSDNWTEHNLSNNNRPNTGSLLGSINENFQIGSTKTIDLEGLDGFSGDKLSLVLNMTSGNDFAFASKENGGVQKAELIITTIPTGGSNTTSSEPIHDAYLQYSRRYNSNIVRVEKGRRTGYLMFDTSNITGTIVDVKLEFEVVSDPGYGNLNVNLGDTNGWTETNLSNNNRPSTGALLGSLNESFDLGTTKTVNLEGLNGFSGDKLSLVLNMTSGNDFAFASKENSQAHAARLVITTVSSDDTNDNSGDRISIISESYEENLTKEDSELSSNSFELYPNPTEKNLNIRFNNNSLKTISKIEIVDGFGRISRIDLSNGDSGINVSKLAPGLYYVRLTIEGTNEVISKVFVKK